MCCFAFGALLGQTTDIDQLKGKLDNAPSDSSKVKNYLKASQYYTFHDLETALKYADSSFTLSKQLHYEDGITSSGLNLAYLFRIRGNYSYAINALHNTFNSLKSSKKLKPLKIYRWLGKNHYESRAYDSALYWTRKTVVEAKQPMNPQQLVYAYSDYANIFYKKYDLDKAVLYYSKADSVSEQHNLNSVSYLSALGRLGKMKFNTELYRKAHDYLEKVRNRFIAQDNPAGVTEITLSMGMLEFNCDNLKKSLPFLFHCLEYYTRLEMTPKQMIVNRTLGEVYLQQNMLELAKKHFTEYLRLSALLKDPFEMSKAHSFLGTSYFKEENYPTALSHFKEAKSFADGLDDIILTYTASQGMANSYLRSSRDEEAAQEFSEIIEIQDSVINLKKNERALALFAEIQAKQKEDKIDLLQSEKALAEQQKKNERNLLLGGIGLTSVIGVLLFFLYRNRQKTNKKLKEIDGMKSDFFANVSHEFRTPLTLISAPIEQKLLRENLDEKERADLKMIQRNNRRLLELVDQLLDLSKIEVGSLKLKVSHGDPLRLIAAVADSFTYAAAEKQITYLQNISTETEKAWFDRDALQKIVVNLLSNAIKYTPNSGTVECHAQLSKEQLKLLIKNTGPGLSEAEQKRIFQRFYQTDEHNSGAGIGLALVNELVNLHRGSIEVKSKKEDWTSFTVTLPIDQNSFSPSELAVSEKPPHSKVPSINEKSVEIESSDVSVNELPILLIVEDNKEVCGLLVDTFQVNYNVLVANDGKEGIDIALEKVPDLIISDIMMPVMDGIGLTKKLKTDERTSHIPIILLTAKAGEENLLIGIETGADDYITKPFNPRILTTKVDKLIAQRKQLQTRYSQEIILKPKDIAITNLDEQFLHKIQTVLDTKLTDSSFNTQGFSDATGMSRMQLHRKLKALTGLSTSEFIRSQRLKLAVTLLEKSDVNISQIGYQVGFNDPSYFTKCFKEAYGCSPSEFISA